MRKLRELLRLKYEARLPQRAIAQACGVGLGTVTAYLRRAAAAGVSWPIADDLDDGALEARLFRRTVLATDRALPVWADLHQELKRPGVTLALLWQEYRAVHPEGYAYSQFCARYRQWARAVKPSMRQVHRAGEKLFIDFAGDRPHWVDATSGEEVPAELFIGVLGASGLIYAEATPSQDLPAWAGAHVHMLDTFGGSPAIWIPDNLKSGVTHAHAYEPAINRTYADLATHYGAVVIPTRVARPKDKPKVEVSVQIAQRWVLAALRHRTFFSLADLNAAIRERVAVINDRPMRVLGVSRRTLFEQLDRPALKPLPATPYELATWKGCRVNIDYHVQVAHNFYSVPYQLVHAEVDTRATGGTLEIFHQGRRVATHVPRTGWGQYATLAEHMPASHRAHAEWTPSRLIAWAEQLGAATGRLVTGLLERLPHPEQGYRACLGLMRLGREHGADRLEAACARAERLRSYRYRTVEHILKSQQDRLPLDEPPARPPLTHENVRGATYYEETTHADPSHD
jgi:transposase